MTDLLPALAARLGALASPVRLRILLALRDGALCPCQLSAVLDVPVATVSSHLLELRRSGLVGESRRGRFLRYALRRSEGTVPWLRLVARQAAPDPRVETDHVRAARIRLVPPEMLGASIDCDAGHPVESPRRRLRSRVVA